MVKKIPLTQGQYALVDDEDFEFLNQFKWHSFYSKSTDGFYVRRNVQFRDLDDKIKQKGVMMHRVIIEHAIGKKLEQTEIIDHINHNPLDNRKSNLRIVSRRQNLQNQKRETSSKYPGVNWDKNASKWRAKIKLNGKLKHLGLFDDEREAAKAYEQVCRELVGEELVCKSGGVV